MMNQIYKRLDLKLSFLIGSVVLLAFGSFMYSLHILHKERLEREFALDRERISTTIKSEKSRILNDILLDHKTAIELTLKQIYSDLNLTSISLVTNKGDKFQHGATTNNAALETYSIDFEGKNYGTLTINKKHIVDDENLLLKNKWILGIALAMLAIFWIIRRFIRKEIIDPMNSLIGSFGSDTDLSKPINIPSNSVEIQNLIGSFNHMRFQLGDFQNQLVQKEKEVALVTLASQVAHDIRSPLSALYMFNLDLVELPENKRILVRSAIQRIQDIANNLIKKKTFTEEINKEEPSSQLLSSLIDSIVSEKRLEFRNLLNVDITANINEKSYGLFAKFQSSIFKIVLSNLINNSVDALREDGKIEIDLYGDNDEVIVTVRDSGRGIPEEMLSKLTQKGFTFGKREGAGLGLYHAKEVITSWGGKIDIQSRENFGTTVKISLKKSPPPSWFIPELKIVKNGTVMIVDDDTTIHQVWQRRLEKLFLKQEMPEVIHFSRVQEVYNWYKTNGFKMENVLFLVDYELIGESKTGLELIDELGIEDKSVLVTSRHEEPKIAETAFFMKLKMIPKTLAGLIPLEIIEKSDSKKATDTILIENDKHLSYAWKESSINKGVNLKTFSSPTGFLIAHSLFNKDIPIYVDRELDNGLKGEDVAKLISGHGFKNVYLTTPYSPEDFKNIPWIKGVIDKTPPWEN